MLCLQAIAYDHTINYNDNNMHSILFYRSVWQNHDFVQVDIRVTDSKEHVLYNKEGTGEQKDEEGKFAFTTDDQDVFEVCFQSKSTGGFSNGKL